jgi:hypothetical protein
VLRGEGQGYMYLVYRGWGPQDDMFCAGEGGLHEFQEGPVNSLQTLWVFPCDPPIINIPSNTNKRIKGNSTFPC